MKKLTDLKIGTQLKIGFGIMLMLMILLGTIAWLQSNRIAQQTETLYNHPLQVRRALGELKADILSMQVEFLRILQSEEPKTRQEAMQKIDYFESDTERQLETISQQYLGPGSDVEEAQKSLSAWIFALKGFSNLVQLNKSIDELKQYDLLVEMDTKSDKVLETIKTIDKFAFNKGNQLYSHSMELKKELNLQLALILAGIILLYFVVIAIVIRNIKRPVNELIRVTRLFGKGKLDVRSNYGSLNEFGALSHSFNTLAETIDQEFTLKTHYSLLNTILLKGLESNAPMRQVLEPLMKTTNAQVGAIYLLNASKTHFELIESVGMDGLNNQKFSAQNFEGELGIALTSRKVELITDIPADTQLSFSAVCGKICPRGILTIPIIDHKNVIAMISLSSLPGFATLSVRLVKDLHGPISTWMNALLANSKIQKMGERLQMQNTELEIQKKELAAQANELLEQNTELEMQKNQLNESNQMKSSFLANMSHELRTPLNSVIALSGVLNRRLAAKIPVEEFSYLTVIERNGKQLLALINDILDLSRIEAGFIEIQVSNFRINTLVHEVVENFTPQANEKNIALHTFPETEIPLIQSDYEKCRHILQNIVANAVKFTDTGEVCIYTRAENESILIEITDTGIGIEEKYLTRIFEEFRQADNSNSRKHGGTGLGLAIAKRYTELLGGKISVESSKGKGSKFTLVLPLQSKLLEPGEISKTTHLPFKSLPVTHQVDGPKGIGKTILLVEDSEAAIIQLKEMLASQGYTTITAKNGIDALKVIEQAIPDALILDLMMPEADGFEVLEKIRENKKTEQLPVLILTAKYITKEDLAFLKHNHIHQLIQKGEINRNQLLGIVSEMVYKDEFSPKPPRQRKIVPSSPTTPTILVVEDNPDNLLTIKALLQGYGKIIESKDGLDAVNLALEHQPDLVLMDIALPEMNGIDILKIMRQTQSLAMVPIVAVSASAMKGDRDFFIENGFDDYISKPIEFHLFEKTLSKVLGQKFTSYD